MILTIRSNGVFDAMLQAADNGITLDYLTIGESTRFGMTLAIPNTDDNRRAVYKWFGQRNSSLLFFSFRLN